MTICGKCGNRLSPGGACYICARIDQESRRYGSRHHKGNRQPEVFYQKPLVRKRTKLRLANMTQEQIEHSVRAKINFYNRILERAFGKPQRIQQILRRNMVPEYLIQRYKSDLKLLHRALTRLDQILIDQSLLIKKRMPNNKQLYTLKVSSSISTVKGRQRLEAAILEVFRTK